MTNIASLTLPSTAFGHDVPVVVSDLLSQLDSGFLSPVRPRRGQFGTGFRPLDAVLSGGFRVHDLVIVGGRPGVGKTIATLQWARNLALDGTRVVYACYEHDERTLLARLLALEIGMLEIPSRGLEDDMELAAVVSEVMAGGWTMASAAGRHPIVRAARAAMDAYADRLTFIPASPSKTDVEALSGAIENEPATSTVLFVDYLQKVLTQERHATRLDQLAATTTALKELALSGPVAVVAIAAAATAGLTSRRVRMHHLEAPSVLGYEADVIVLLNEKGLAVSKVHLTYDTSQVERLRRFVVFSVEKNRGGPSLVDCEFEKDFAHFRFRPQGSYVAEHLIDDMAYSD